MASILTGSTRVRETTHRLPTEWLGARVVGWMFAECGGLPWWAVGLTNDSKLIAAAHKPGYQPHRSKMQYAIDVLRHVNKTAGYGGAWLAAWIENKTFVLIWKDPDGDIAMQDTCDKPFSIIREWPMTSWENQCHQMYAQWYEIEKIKELRDDQTVKLAQGQAISRRHQAIAATGYEVAIDPFLDST